MWYTFLVVVNIAACAMSGGLAAKEVWVAGAIFSGLSVIVMTVCWAANEIVTAIKAQRQCEGKEPAVEAYGHVCKESPLGGPMEKGGGK